MEISIDKQLALDEVTPLLPAHMTYKPATTADSGEGAAPTVPADATITTATTDANKIPIVQLQDSSYVVVLYYHYHIFPNDDAVQKLCDDNKRVCEALRLNGRLRLSIEGLNGTLGGRWDDIASFVYYLRCQCDASLGASAKAINFKFGMCNKDRDENVQKFKSLSVKVTKEVVTLLPEMFDEKNRRVVKPKGPLSLPSECGTARHASAAEFHETLTKGKETGDVVLLDVRNNYETAVGHFDVEGVPRIDPDTRQFSEFPQFVEKNKNLFKGKKVLMYCTGGVRCERASQIFADAADQIGHKDVVQLNNGIHHYLDSYPEGGHFAGRNFVFDGRMAVPPPQLVVPTRPRGTCVGCATPHDDYTNEARCVSCRLRILVCPKCLEEKGRSYFECLRCTNAKKEAAAAAAAVDATSKASKDDALEAKRVRKE